MPNLSSSPGTVNKIWDLFLLQNNAVVVIQNLFYLLSHCTSSCSTVSSFLLKANPYYPPAFSTGVSHPGADDRLTVIICWNHYPWQVQKRCKKNSTTFLSLFPSSHSSRPSGKSQIQVLTFGSWQKPEQLIQLTYWKPVYQNQSIIMFCNSAWPAKLLPAKSLFTTNDKEYYCVFYMLRLSYYWVSQLKYYRIWNLFYYNKPIELL